MKKSLILFVTALLAFNALNAQYSIRSPDAIPLHGAWSFALDPLDAGGKQEWYLSTKPFQNWDKVEVPHCFSVDPRYQFFTGSVWYRRVFQWQIQSGKRVILHFDGVYYECSVWINNQLAGAHEGGYTPFQFDITYLLKPGENHIAIQVNNNTWKHGTIPGPKEQGPNTQFPGWLNYGGITRPVYLTVEQQVYLENLKVESQTDLLKKTAQLHVKVFIRKPFGSKALAKPSLTVFLGKRELALSWKMRNVGDAQSDLVQVEADASLKPGDIRLWSVDEPICYRLQAILAGDTVTTSFGIRKVEVKNAQLLLNGEPIRLAGANRVMDYPGLGSLEPDWLVEKDLRLMKEAGMEFQRLTHYTTTEAVLDWADRNGMLIVAEVGNWQLTPEQMDNDTIRTKFKQQFREMVERDWNHPSLIAYSVGNEYLSETPSGQRWTKDMIAFARELDPTRLYTFASMRLNTLPENPEDEASQYVDFVSANIYGNHAVVLDHIHRLYPDKPVLISEYGARADGKQGEDGQVEYLKNILELIRKRPYVAGASWWSFNDYQSRYVGTNKNGYRPWGLVTPDRSLRQVYAYHRSEMSTVMIQRKKFLPGNEGVHHLIVEIKNRFDFPAYTIRNYTLKAGDYRTVIPELQPGESVELSIPIRGFDPTLNIEIIKPTGFTIVDYTIELKND